MLDAVLAAVRRVVRGAPRDCGGPGGRPYVSGSYADRVSPDQLRIAEALPTILGARSRLLHVGVGSSDLAVRFHDRVAAIDGITVLDDELAVAEGLGFANYRVWKLDKHAPGITGLPGAYDVIVDNNPGGFACCRKHFDATMRAYAGLLAPGGRVVTDARGAGWRQRRAIALGWRAWAREGRALGLVPERLTASVWAWRDPRRAT